MTKIKAFEKISRSEYNELDRKLSKAFETAGKLGNSQVKIREKIEELQLMEIVEDPQETTQEPQRDENTTGSTTASLYSQFNRAYKYGVKRHRIAPVY